MKVPCRVLKGTGGSGGSYYWDGVNPMTVLGGGIGALLVDGSLFDLPTVTLPTGDFNTLQQYLVDRKAAFDQLAACESCPEGVVGGAAAEIVTDLQAVTGADNAA